MIYWIILILLFILAVLSESKLTRTLKYLLIVIAAGSLTLLAGLRGNIEPDYANYEEMFDNVGIYLSQGGEGVEHGYLFLNYIIKAVGLGFQAVVFIMAFLAIVPKVIFFYKHSPNFLFSSLVYFTSIYFLFDFIAIRQAVTITIFMCSLVFVLERRLVPYLICIVLGAFIHSSILLLLPGYFIFSKKISGIYLYCIVGICAVINILQIKIGLVEFALEKFVLPEAAAGKAAFYGAEQNFAFVSLKQIVLAMIFIFLNDKKQSNAQFKNILTNIFVAGIIFATVLNGIPQLSYRIKWYFFWPEAILIIYFVKYLSFEKLPFKYLMYLALLALYANTMFVLLNELATRGNYIYPYKTFIDQ
ncbi:EpsG family protein [Pedobacter xixiisoli]|uniref:EpsG family protein n=1 Tax=Pedobacter xixiisoli TaxID=1476464 RepID=A0A286AEK4_9SPHI|nr:EpsG family protein [Pedobacter xixiisoli]SOD20338.1 EpsG family protein [Pedobacter xixiisoli]